jgi:hypothetical protein
LTVSVFDGERAPAMKALKAQAKRVAAVKGVSSLSVRIA